MAKVKVYIQLKPTVLDAQGQVVRNALRSLGYDQVETVRMGKYVELEVSENGRPVEDEVREIRGKDIAMIVQDPLSSLNPVWKVGFQIEEAMEALLRGRTDHGPPTTDDGLLPEERL